MPSLLRQSQNLFSQLENAIMQEDIIQKVHGLQITASENVQSDEANTDSDNVWIRCRGNAASTVEEQASRTESIEQLVTIIRNVLQSDASFTAHGDGHGNSSDQPRTGAWSSFASNPGPSEMTSPRKRKGQPLGDDPGDGNSDSEGDYPRRPMKALKLESPLIRRRFACPYFKRSTIRYMHQRSCAGPGWPSVHRLKEHLFRVHRLPKFRCNRCAWEFQNSKELASHQRSTRPCELQVFEDQLEGINSEQEAQLKSRKKDSTNKPEEDKWFDVYRILFPTDDLSNIPTPYYEYPEANNNKGASKDYRGDDDDDGKLDVTAYRSYLASDLPSALQQEVERDVELALHTSNHVVKDRIVKLVRALQPKLLKGFLKAQQSSLASDNRALGLNRITPLQEQEPGNTSIFGMELDMPGHIFEDLLPLDENSLFDLTTKCRLSDLQMETNPEVLQLGHEMSSLINPYGDSNSIGLPDLPTWSEDVTSANETSGEYSNSSDFDAIMFSDIIEQ
ncbi:Putative proteasome subunit alpha type-7 [Hypoxylon texense]